MLCDATRRPHKSSALVAAGSSDEEAFFFSFGKATRLLWWSVKFPCCCGLGIDSTPSFLFNQLICFTWKQEVAATSAGSISPLFVLLFHLGGKKTIRTQ